MLRPLTLSSVASRAVRNSTGVRVPPERSRLATSKPSRSGSITSSTTRSGRWRWTVEMASSPPVAVATSNPARRRLAERSSRMLGSSSTTSSRASGVVSLMAAILTAGAWRRLAGSWEVPGSGEWWPSTSTPPAPGGAHGRQRRHRRLRPVRPALQLQDGPADHLPAWRGGGRHPLSIAVANGRAYFVTAGDSGKAQRLAHTDRVTLAPCTVGGKVTGDTVEGRARRLVPDER